MKLVILNGSPAAGKSTLAERLHLDMPLSLRADLDEWRRLIGNYREQREESLALTYKFAVAAVDAYLETGHDVIVDKAILSSVETLDALVEAGKKHGADVHEFILLADKDTIVARAAARGFRENSLLTPERVVALWEIAQQLALARPQAIVIDTSLLTAEEVYEQVRSIVM